MSAAWRLLVCGILGICTISAAAALPSRRAEGLAQWHVVESVLMSPRCLNCHTVTDYPRQGDDRHRHNFLVQRGPHDRGVPGSQCTMCHHDTNSTASGVPGAHGWHLAPLSMSWERAPGVPMTSRELCAVLTDLSRNGHRDGGKLLEHITSEPLVLWAFSPGKRANGTWRKTPPVSHDELVAATRAWVQAGSPCP